MSVSNDRAGAPTRRHARVIKVAPVTRAIRAALAVSATTLALGASGGAFAAAPAAPNATAIHRTSVFHRADIQPVLDPTRVLGDDVPRNVVPAIDGGASRPTAITRVADPADAPVAQSFGDVQDLMAVPTLTPGPGGVSGSDDSVYFGASGTTSLFSNTGYFTATTSTTGLADFVFASSDHFDGFVNNANISATGYTWAAGFELESDTYASNVRNSGAGTMTLQATGDFGQAWGIYTVANGDAAIYNDGGIDVSATGYAGTATGLFDYSTAGNASADNTGTISADASGDYGQARGAYAAAYGDANVTNTSIVSATAYGYGGVATGISAYSSHGDAIAGNSGNIAAISYAAATGMRGYAVTGNVDLDNSGDIVAVSYAGNAIGMYGYALAGDVTIDNSGTIGAYSYFGLADGIFASGNTVGITSSGSIDAYGYSWAAGIEARGNDAASVTNSGAISAGTYNGAAFGIYATGGAGGITIDNAGPISAVGLFSTGIDATASGDISITNTGDILAGSTYYTVLAIGIEASNNYAGSSIAVTNGGDLSAYGYFGAYGINVAAVGAGGTASVTNSGNLYASVANKYGYGAMGIFASADGNSMIANTGAITVDSSGAAYGAMALSFNGTASVTNAGDIDVTTTAMRYYAGVGILASSTNGAASVDNSGNITVDATKYLGTGIQVSGDTGAIAINSGAIDVGAKYAYGIAAIANQGDASITNAAGGSIGVYSGAPNGFAAGALAISTVGDVSVTNNGSIDAEAYGNAFGVFASAAAGNASAANGGSVYAYSYGNRATGVLVQAIGGDATVRNTGDITAVSDYGAAFAIDASAYGGNVVVTSGGTLQAGSYHGTAVGISAYALDGNAEVDNSGSIAAISIYGNAIGISTDVSNGIASAGNGGSITVAAPHGNAIGISGYATGGDVDLGNIGGNITVVAPDYSAIGLAAYSSGGNVSLNNDARITATGHTAIGTYGNAASGIVSVDNSGAIGAYSDSGFADGVLAYGAAVDVFNTASIDAEGYNWAAGIEAHGSDAASVTNGGDIVAISTGDVYSSYATGNIVVVPHSRAYGVYAAGGVGGVSVTNAAGGSIGAYGYDATGIFGFSADGDVSIDNGGAITSVGVSNSHGALALSYQGDADIGNSGDIDASSQSGDAVGLLVVSTGGTATADNSGDVVAQSGRYATGIAAQGYAGAVVTNSGSVSAVGTYVNGVVALTYQGDVSVNNDAAGSVSAQSYTGSAAGLVGTSTLGDVTIDNGGNVAAIAYGNATGIYAGSSYGDVSVANIGDVYSSVDTGLGIGISAVAGDGGAASVTNSGGVDAASEYGVAVGIYAAGNGLVSVTNSGTINVDGDSLASGIGALGQAVMVDNSGTIHAYGHAASGINVYGLAGAQVVNSGTVDATSTAGGDAVGVHAYAYGNLLVYNTGTITATDDDYAVAVDVDAVHIATVVNAGTLRTTSTTEGQVAVRGGDGVQQIFNYGDIYGAIITGGGDDTFANRSGGVWNVSNHSTDFGDGDDSITNGAGGTIVLANGAIHMGASGAAGNAFTNSGRILVQGSGLIDMGGGAPASNALPLVNNGLVDFVDGMPDDILTIAGDLAGAGSINVDVSPLNQGADLLYVEGNITGGSVQTVNVNFTDFPALGQVYPIAFAHVSGDSTAGSFVAGQVVGFSANNFLDMQVAITSQLDPTNATDDVFSVGVDVTGLSDPGTLGASVASGAQSLLTSQIGTWRQRMGVLPDANPANVGVSPWIRVFSDKGEVDPTHVADNFGNGGNFDYDQSNSGREVGMNIDFRGGFNAGLLLAKSDGTQHLRGPGVGSDHLSGSAFGLYGTWIGDNGFYVDASYRWFDFTADLHSAAGKQSTEGQGGAFNVEAGFTAWKVAGIDVAPQVQYTRAAIGNIRPIHGDQVDFVSNGGTSSRGRVGVAFSRKIDNAGWIWTPYGSVNAVREFDGKTDYTIADTFTGSTRTDGTSAMVELGVGAQKDGLSVTAGANWTDGGALQSFVGGQLVLRYTW